MSSAMKQLKQLYNENKEYLKSIGLDSKLIKRCLKTKISTPETIIKAIKTKLNKHNKFNKESEDILNEFNNIDSKFNENKLLNDLIETENELEINDIETNKNTLRNIFLKEVQKHYLKI